MTTFNSLIYYAALGLYPGDFAFALLMEDLSLAYNKSHPFLYTGDHGQDIVKNMMAIIDERIPSYIRGSESVIKSWMSHSGYFNAPPTKRAQFIMFCIYPNFLKKITKICEDKATGKI